MKKNILYSLTFIIMIVSLISCSSERENEIENLISYEELPLISQSFLEKYFGGKESIEKIEKENQNGITIYEVDLKNGYEIVFNSSGYWQEIYAPNGETIPMSILPEPIAQTLNLQYHGYGVIEINTTGENYHVVLSNNQGGESIELLFNQSGEILN